MKFMYTFLVLLAGKFGPFGHGGQIIYKGYGYKNVTSLSGTLQQGCPYK
jgi:hypothetical protein